VEFICHQQESPAMLAQVSRGFYANSTVLIIIIKRICIAQVCRMTSEALGGQLQSCYTARAGPKCLTEEKCFKTTLEQS